MFSKKVCDFIKKENRAQVFSCEFWEISRNTCFTDHLRMTDEITVWNVWNLSNFVLYYFVIVIYLSLRYSYNTNPFVTITLFQWRYNYIFCGTLHNVYNLRYNYILSWFVITSQWRCLFVECSYVFMMTLELRYNSARSICIRKLSYHIVFF